MENDSSLLKKLEIANKLIADQKYALDKAAIVAITDSKGYITYVNDQFCEISGYSEEELIGKTHQLVNSGIHPRDFFISMWKTIASGQVWYGEICNRTKSGNLYWVDTTIVPFLDDKNKPYQYIAIRSDITHKKKALAELEKEKVRAFSAEKMASLGILSSGISHELGNPLGALRGRAEMLERLASREEVLEAEKVKDVALKMVGLIDRMSKIIRGLRAYARDGSQDPFSRLDLVGLVSDIVEISKDRCRKHDVRVEVVAESDEVFIMGRESEIGQVVVNLFNNAVDAAKSSSEKWILFKIGKTDSNIISLKVIDSGPGIPTEKKNQIFDPFFTSKPVGEGTGLGLSISKSIVETHHGEIHVALEDKHTCFEVLLPSC